MKAFRNNKFNNFTFSVKQVFLTGSLAFLSFAVIENILSLFVVELYWQYYVFSVLFWQLMYIIYYLSFYGFYPLVKKLIFHSGPKGNKNDSRLFSFLIILILSPSLFYTILHIIKITPFKNISWQNLIITLLVLCIFFIFLRYLYRNLITKEKREIIYSLIFISSILYFSGIFGVLWFVSEFQKIDQWVYTIFLIVFFNLAVPFIIVYFFNSGKNIKTAKKFLLAGGLGFFMVMIGVTVVKPAVRDLASKQKSSFEIKSNKAQIDNSPNIILITMDTTRAANMSLYGYSRLTTPKLEKFARDATLFKNAISSSSWTLPSHASLFTGLPSFMHGATHGKTEDIIAYPLGEGFETLAELLSKNGYNTGAVVANFAFLAPWTGLNQGFDYYAWGTSVSEYLSLNLFFNVINQLIARKPVIILESICGISGKRSAKKINRISMDWILKNKQKKSPWFLFINYMETHGTAYLPPPFSKMFTSSPWLDFKLLRNKEEGKAKLDKQKISKIRNWYDNELSYLDHEIGNFIQQLKENGLYDNTLIIITSDHGELLGEHGGLEHGHLLYQELIHVPLIMKYPAGEKRGTITNKFVQDIDIFAEILNEAYITLPGNVMGQPFDRITHPILSEIYSVSAQSGSTTYSRDKHDLRALYLKELNFYKLIESSKGNRELYNLKLDPKEKKVIIDLKLLGIAQNELENLIILLKKERKKINIFRSRLKKLDKVNRDRLRTLGYINKKP